MSDELLEVIAQHAPQGDDSDVVYDAGLKALEHVPPGQLAALVERLWRMTPLERGQFEARCYSKLPPSGGVEREPLERSFYRRGLAMALEAATRTDAPVDPALIGEMWKAGRQDEASDPFLQRVVLDACRRFKALDAVPDLIQEGMLVEAAAIDWGAALRRLPALAIRAEEGVGLSVIPDLPDTRVAGTRYQVITDLYRMMVIALPQHAERRGKITELLQKTPEEIRALVGRSAYFGLSRALVVTRLSPEEVRGLLHELETAWRDLGFPPDEYAAIENAYYEGLKLEDRYFEALYRKT